MHRISIFAMIKRKLLIFILLLAGYAYLASALEMDRDECKKNFDSEQQYKIATLNADHSDLQVVLAFDIPVFFRVNFTLSSIKMVRAISLPVIQFPDPPDKLFIRYSLLLI